MASGIELSSGVTDINNSVCGHRQFEVTISAILVTGITNSNC